MKKRDRIPSHDYDEFWINPWMYLSEKQQKEREHGPVTRFDVTYALDRSSAWRDVVIKILDELHQLKNYTADVTAEETLGISMGVITYRVLDTFLNNKKGNYDALMKYFVDNQQHALGEIRKKYDPIEFEDEEDEPPAIAPANLGQTTTTSRRGNRVLSSKRLANRADSERNSRPVFTSGTTTGNTTPKMPPAARRAIDIMAPYSLNSPRSSVSSDVTELDTKFENNASRRLVPYPDSTTCLKCGKYKAGV